MLVSLERNLCIGVELENIISIVSVTQFSHSTFHFTLEYMH
jgi:hypothetical protein